VRAQSQPRRQFKPGYAVGYLSQRTAILPRLLEAEIYNSDEPNSQIAYSVNDVKMNRNVYS